MFFSLNLSIQLFFLLLIEKTFWIHLENLTDNLEQMVYVPAKGIVMSHQFNILKKKKNNKQTKRNRKKTYEARERSEQNQVNCYLLVSQTLKNGIFLFFLQNVQMTNMDETVYKPAVKIVMCPRHATKRPVPAMVAVLKDGNYLSAIKVHNY